MICWHLVQLAQLKRNLKTGVKKLASAICSSCRTTIQDHIDKPRIKLNTWLLSTSSFSLQYQHIAKGTGDEITENHQIEYQSDTMKKVLVKSLEGKMLDMLANDSTNN